MYQLIDIVRQKNPLVLHYTNEVTINDCANATLAVGASPLMSYSYDEFEELISIASSVVVNIGTMNPSYMDLFLQAGVTANSLGKPVVFDPVGVFASTARKEFTDMFLSQVRCSVIKGNHAEIQFLSGATVKGQGVDSHGSGGDLSTTVRELARKFETIVVATGTEDYVSDGVQVVKILNGTPRLRQVTGTGCMTSSLVGAYVGAAGNHVECAVMGVLTMALSGELSDEAAQGVGTFKTRLFDNISLLNSDILGKLARVNR